MTIHRRLIALVLTVTASATGIVATVSASVPPRTLVASEGLPRDRFGSVVVTNSGILAVASARSPAPGSANDPLSNLARPVYVFERLDTAWTEVTRVLPQGLTRFDQFGSAVALNGDLLAVGAPGIDGEGEDDVGAVFVYRRSASGWVFEKRLDPPPPERRLYFGTAVAISDDRIAVGAPNAQGQFPVKAIGAAFVYVHGSSGWVLEQQIDQVGTAVDGTAFAESVALAGDKLLVGAPAQLDAGGTIVAGAVHAYRRSGTIWFPEGRIDAPAPHPSGRFGAALDIDAESAVVGEPGRVSPADSVEAVEGRLHVLVRADQRWVVGSAITVGPEALSLGAALDLLGDILVAGAPLASSGDGEVFAFRRIGGVWTRQRGADRRDLLLESRGARLGTAVAVDGNTILAGAPRGGQAGEETGVVQAFEGFGRRLGNLLPIGARVVKRGRRLRLDSLVDSGTSKFPAAAPCRADITVGAHSVSVSLPRFTKTLVPAGTRFDFDDGTLAVRVLDREGSQDRLTVTLVLPPGTVVANAPVAVRLHSAAFGAEGAFTLDERGRFAPRRMGSTLLPGTEGLLRFDATVRGSGRGRFIAEWAIAPRASPAQAPAFLMRLAGGAFSQTLPSSALIALPKNAGFEFRGTYAGITRAVIDYRRGRVLVRGRRAALPQTGDGVVATSVEFALDQELHAYDVHCVQKDGTLRY